MRVMTDELSTRRFAAIFSATLSRETSATLSHTRLRVFMLMAGCHRRLVSAKTWTLKEAIGLLAVAGRMIADRC
jgi:integral membrane sensor domain MASE1